MRFIIYIATFLLITLTSCNHLFNESTSDDVDDGIATETKVKKTGKKKAQNYVMESEEKEKAKYYLWRLSYNGKKSVFPQFKFNFKMRKIACQMDPKIAKSFYPSLTSTRTVLCSDGVIKFKLFASCIKKDRDSNHILLYNPKTNKPSAFLVLSCSRTKTIDVKDEATIASIEAAQKLLEKAKSKKIGDDIAIPSSKKSSRASTKKAKETVKKYTTSATNSGKTASQSASAIGKKPNAKKVTSRISKRKIKRKKTVTVSSKKLSNKAVLTPKKAVQNQEKIPKVNESAKTESQNIPQVTDDKNKTKKSASVTQPKK